MSKKSLIFMCTLLSLFMSPSVAFAGGSHHPDRPGSGRPDRPDRPDRPNRPDFPDFPEFPGFPGFPGFPDFPESPAVGEEIQAYVTGYSFWDNTPPGSSEISHPVIHRQAGGRGTFRNPVTVAVGHSYINGRDVLDYEPGTMFYVPSLRKYFIVEDTCGDGPTPQNGPCHDLSQAPRDAETWLDVWAGGANSTNGQADACMSRLTGVHTVIIDPESGYSVVPGSIVSRNRCLVGFSDEVRFAGE